MKAADYCRKRASDAGYDHLYRFIFTSRPQFDGVVAVRALEDQLDNLVEATSETSVAMTQLAWWHEEIARLLAGEARHPTTRVLAELDLNPALLKTQTTGWLESTARAIEQPAVFSHGEWRERVDAGPGSADRLIAHITECDAIESWQPDYSHARRLARALLSIGRDLRAGYTALPLEWIEASGLNPAELLDNANGKSAALIEKLRLQALTDIDALVSTVDASGVSAPLAVTLGTFGARLERCAEAPGELLHADVRLTALSQVLVARRIYRQTKKAQA